MLYHWGVTSIEISSITFLNPKWNAEVVSGFEKCLSLFGNRIKQERIYHCKMTNRLVLILQNPATTWVSCIWWKKQELCYDKIILREKVESNKIYYTHFSYKQK